MLLVKFQTLKTCKEMHCGDGNIFKKIFKCVSPMESILGQYKHAQALPPTHTDIDTNTKVAIEITANLNHII